ncbi:hypothetical protein BHM03_00011968 [Ensete ventricosum]|nr:hypothetical protein BHM03_00011968 [Ensete ventricosum]
METIEPHTSFRNKRREGRRRGSMSRRATFFEGEDGGAPPRRHAYTDALGAYALLIRLLSLPPSLSTSLAFRFRRATREQFSRCMRLYHLQEAAFVIKAHAT